jgi:hypothetical protein
MHFDLTEFGAKGDGVSDDSGAFQDAIDRLIVTGGALWIPPNRKYVINTPVTIKSYYAIFLVSNMGQAGMDADAATTGGCIVPGDDITDGMFIWDDPDDATDAFQGGGGGIIRLQFNDNQGGYADWRQHSVDSVLYCKNAYYFEVQEGYFGAIKGTAIRVGNSVRCQVKGGRISRCGNASRSPVHVEGVVGQNNGFAGLYMNDTIIEGSHLAPAMTVGSGTGANLRKVYFENNTSEAELQYSFVHVVGTVDLFKCSLNALGSAVAQVTISSDANTPFQKITHCAFNGDGTAIDITNNNAQYMQIEGNFFKDCGSATDDCINSEAAATTLIDNTFYATGKIDLNSTLNVVLNNKMYSCLNSTAFDVPARSQFEGNYSDTDNTGKTRLLRTYPCSLLDFRETDSNADVGAITANGGILASDTTPILRGDANGAQEIVWAAGNVDPLVAERSLPDVLDDTADLSIDFFVSTDNAGVGSIDEATMSLITHWDTGTAVVDNAIDFTPSTTLHTVTATIAAADIPSGARTMTMRLIPGAHASNPIRLHGWRVRAYEYVVPV